MSEDSAVRETKTFTYWRHTTEPNKGWLSIVRERDTDEPYTITYDPNAPCIYCGQPVVSLSMGGSAVCPWCDCGKHRDGREWTLDETLEMFRRARERFQQASR